MSVLLGSRRFRGRTSSSRGCPLPCMLSVTVSHVHSHHSVLLVLDTTIPTTLYGMPLSPLSYIELDASRTTSFTGSTRAKQSLPNNQRRLKAMLDFLSRTRNEASRLKVTVNEPGQSVTAMQPRGLCAFESSEVSARLPARPPRVLCVRMNE